MADGGITGLCQVRPTQFKANAANAFNANFTIFNELAYHSFRPSQFCHALSKKLLLLLIIFNQVKCVKLSQHCRFVYRVFDDVINSDTNNYYNPIRTELLLSARLSLLVLVTLVGQIHLTQQSA
jgi:hypothetical protein